MEHIGGVETVVTEHEPDVTEDVVTDAPLARERIETGVRDRTVYLLAGALLVGLSFWWTQFATQSICCGDFDGYYHYRLSRMLEDGMRTGQFPPRFEALPLTTLNADDYVDHHFLFHILQIPFTWFESARRAAWALLVVSLLFSPLVYRRTQRLARAGHTRFVAAFVSALAGLVVIAALFEADATIGWKVAGPCIAAAAIALCWWLTTRLLMKGQTRPVAALAALSSALLVPMAFFRLTTLYQTRAAELFASDPYAGFQYGAKLGAWLFACAAVMACFWLVVHYRLRYPMVWLFALLACSGPFLYRMNMAKAMSVSIVLLIAGIYLLFQRKYLALLPLAYVFALTYDMVLLLWVAAFIWLGVTIWSEDWDVLSKPVLWAAGGLVLVVAGTALGFVINPYFPRNVQLMYEHMLMKITPGDFSTAVGGEWYPYSTWEFLWGSTVACVAMVVGYISVRGPDRKERARALFLLFFATFLMVVNARWKRFAEYWPPFAVLFAAFSLQPYLARLGRVDDGEERWRYASWLEYGLATASALALAAVAVGAAILSGRDIKDMDPPRQYLGGMEWVKQNVPAGEMIFNTDWDDFPKLFFYSPAHRYASGLDPTYLQDRDKDLSALYARIGLGEERNPGPPIRERFGARYVFTDKHHDGFMQNALPSGDFEVVYEDDNCTVLRVLYEPAKPEGEDKPATDEGDAKEVGHARRASWVGKR